MSPAASPYFAIAPRAGAIPALDGLRGIAILLVLVRHAVRPIWEQSGTVLRIGPWDLAAPLLNGWAGVDLFFVLSGFLIARHLLAHEGQRWPPGFFARYVARRVLRTFPAYYAVLAIVALGLLPFFRPHPEDPANELLVHLVFLQDYAGSRYVAAFWSLGVEEKFYLVCPLVLALLRRRPVARQMGFLAALATLPIVLRGITLAANAPAAGDYEHFFWSTRAPFHLAMDGLWMGVVCALIARWRPAWCDAPHRPAQLLCCGLALLALLLLPVAWFDAGWWRSAVLALNLVPLAFALIVLASVLGRHALSRLLEARWLRIVAVLSYSLYLVHLPVLPLALDLAQSLPGSGAGGPLLQALVLMSVLLGLSLAAALLLHLTVEKPFLLLKERVPVGRANPDLRTRARADRAGRAAPGRVADHGTSAALSAGGASGRLP